MKTKITITTIGSILFTVLILIIGCSSNSVKASGQTTNQGSVNNPICVYADKDNNNLCRVYLIKVRGHEYLVSYTGNSYGGTCIIHAAHCQCPGPAPETE